MGYWRTLHLFDDKKFHAEVVPTLKGEKGGLTADCQEFLKFHVTGSTSHLSKQELEKLVKQTMESIISISRSFDSTFKINDEYQKKGDCEEQVTFLDSSDSHYDFAKFFEFYIFKTCADFFPHLPLGKGGVFRYFDYRLPEKTLSSSIIGDLDDWNHHLYYDGMGITSWISNEELQYLYLDRENLQYDDTLGEGFLSLLEIAHSNELGFITGVDMRESILKLLPSNKTVKPETWTLQNSSELLWK